MFRLQAFSWLICRDDELLEPVASHLPFSPRRSCQLSHHLTFFSFWLRDAPGWTYLSRHHVNWLHPKVQHVSILQVCVNGRYSTFGISLLPISSHQAVVWKCVIFLSCSFCWRFYEALSPPNAPSLHKTWSLSMSLGIQIYKRYQLLLLDHLGWRTAMCENGQYRARL